MMATRGHRRSAVPGWIRSAAGLLIAYAVIDYLVLPRLAGTEKSLHLLAEIRPGWVVAGVVFEAASLVCYSLFTRSLLRDSGVSFSRMLRSDLTGFGVSHVVPGGGAGATALRFRLLVTSGATATQVTAAIAAEGVGTWLALVLVLWVTLIPAMFVLGASSLLLTLFLVGAVIVVCGAAAVRERSRLAKPAARLLHFALRRFPARVRPWLAGVAMRLRGLVSDRVVLRAFAVWATANWLLDAVALWLFLAAYGYWMNPVVLLLAYCIGSLSAVVPITPGGIGVIEGVLISTLLGFGVPGGIAVLGVVSWRLIQYWAPIPVAGLCYLSLRTPGWRDRAGGPPDSSKQTADLS